MTPVDPPRAAYVHVPFCRHRCGYCDFTLIAGRDELRDAYLDALEREIDGRHGHTVCGVAVPIRSEHGHVVDSVTVAPEALELDTLFFGGGTPSHLTEAQIARLFAIVGQRFRPPKSSETSEVSLEANPLDLTDNKLALLARLGVNRLSLGVQAFDARVLQMLERDHSPDDVCKLIPRAQRWFDNLSIDLIFGVSGQSLETWRDSLRQAVGLGVTHISTYGLTFEPGTAFTTRRNRGELQAVDQELERAQYAAAMDDLAAAGFEHYEISNFARPGFRCRHNLNYWRGGTYFGFGPGAARYVNGRRETNSRSTLGYLARLSRGMSATAESEELDAEGRARELVFLGLRTSEGIERAAFQARTGFALDELFCDAIAKNVESGWLVDDGERLWLTHEGRFVADRVVADFL
jgi:oxygen-independent coproporphyrinogen-3 oxidase